MYSNLFQTNATRFPHLIILSLLCILSGCTKKHPTYQLKNLQPKVAYDQITKKTESGEVVVRCSTCSRSMMHDLLGKASDALFSMRSHKRIVPIHISVENNSDIAWSLSPYDVHLPRVDMQLVKSRFCKGPVKHGIASLGMHIGLGLLCASVGTAAVVFNPLVGASFFGLGCSILLTSPVASHNKAASIGEQNTAHAHALDEISLIKQEVIHPHEQLNKLIFIEQKNLSKSFDLRLCNVAHPECTLPYHLYLEA